MATKKEPQTIEEKLDIILAQQETIIEQQQEISDKLSSLNYGGAAGYYSDYVDIDE